RSYWWDRIESSSAMPVEITPMFEVLRTQGLPARLSRRMVLVCLTLVTMVGLPVVVAVQTPKAPPMKAGEVVRLDPDEARKGAAEARDGSSIELAKGLELN